MMKGSGVYMAEKASSTKGGKKSAKVIDFTNQKGGVGKTSISFNVAMRAKEMGRRVLVIDTDSQGNLSQILTGDLDIQKNEVGGAGVLFELGHVPPDAPMQTLFDGVSLLHGHKGLDQFDNDEDVEDRVYSAEFRQMLHGLPYDVVIIDTPPALGIRHIAPLIWSDLVVIPMEPALAAVVGFQDVLAAIEIAQRHNPALEWMGVLNRASKSSRSHRETEEIVRKSYGKKIAPTLTSRTAVADGMQEVPALPVWRVPNAKRELRALWADFCTQVING